MAVKQDHEATVKFFEENGYAVVPSFASHEECDGMMERMAELVQDWYQSAVEKEKKELESGEKGGAPHIFSTGEKSQLSHQAKDKYFLESANRIHFFLESTALSPDSTCPLSLKPGISPLESLNKVGHALHKLDDVFKKYSTSEKIHDLVAALGYKNPVLPQSMYIFKHKLIGSEVTSHQDSSFLYTTPRPTCLGMWLALEDATLENGCLWARPGSHKEPVRRQFARNPEYFEEGKGPLMTFRTLDENENVTWEGKMPEPDPQSAGFAAVPIKKGDLFLIHGQVDHLSLPNTSAKGRQTFQLHLVEGPEAGITWSPENWLQLPAGESFLAL